MKNKVKLTFRTMREHVYIRFDYNGVVRDRSTGMRRLSGKTLDAHLGYTGKSGHESDENEKLLAYRERVKAKINDAFDIDPSASLHNILDHIDGKKFVSDSNFTASGMVMKYLSRLSENRIRVDGNGRHLSEFTIKDRSSKCSKILEIIKHAGDVDFGKYNIGSVPVVGEPVVVREINNFTERLIRYMQEQKYNDSSIHSYVSTLKVVLRYFEGAEGIRLGYLIDGLKYVKPNYDVYVMTIAQSRFVIANYKRIKDECTTEAQKNAVDYWVTALLLTPRFGDMRRWKVDSLFKVGDQTWIGYVSGKTGAVVQVPVPSMLLDIFLENARRYSGHLLPPTNHTISSKIKSIAKRYDVFNSNVKTWKMEGGKRVDEIKKSWEMLHIHMMRATAITNMLESDGGKPHVVKGYSGHSEDSRSFGRYVKARGESIDVLSDGIGKLMGINK